MQRVSEELPIDWEEEEDSVHSDNSFIHRLTYLGYGLDVCTKIGDNDHLIYCFDGIK